MKEERRLVWRVLWHWTEMSHSGRFSRRDQIDPWMRGEDGAVAVTRAVLHRVNAFFRSPSTTIAVPKVMMLREYSADLRGAQVLPPINPAAR
jgi:hypothetical protein